MVYVLAVASAFCSAMGGVLQRLGVETAPASDAMRLRLLTNAFRRGIWLLGFAFLLLTFVLQAMALRFGDLSVVQPVVTTDLLFVIAILALWFHRHVGWREAGGSLAVVVGLAGFLVLASPAAGKGIPGDRGWGIVTAVVVGVTVILVAAGQRGPRWTRAAVLGTAAAMLFAYNASLTKATTTLITEGWGHVFTHWEPYMIGVAGGLGFFLLQNALHAGPLAASRAAGVIVNPLVSIVIGVSVFDEHLRGGPVFVAAEIVALAVMCGGAFVLTQSPLVTGTGAEADQGELLGPVAPAMPATGQVDRMGS